MLGCPEMYVGLYTEHIPLKEVPEALDEAKLTRFLLDFQRETGAGKIAVLGLNPHAGDHGVLGDEERIIQAAIDNANEALLATKNSRSSLEVTPSDTYQNSSLLTSHSSLFIGPLVPDTAFTPAMREQFRYYVAMYHDQGLIPLKALHFDESINVSLNLPILRTSVDHGTAFDIAYTQAPLNTESYLNAVRYIVERDLSQP
jgi:4-hydroxythreonine-4-phosphate dehydrogenase